MVRHTPKTLSNVQTHRIELTAAYCRVVIEYQKNIHDQLGHQKGFLRTQYKTLVPGHVGMWVLRRSLAV